jgi:NO-binding membrane sensor protein with MHYT domain
MVHVHNFSYGPVTPVLGYVMSCLGCFLGLRCTTRARATRGAQRARWLLLATVSIATTGIWVMHFVAMLGFTIPGQTITYNVPITILSMLIAIVVVGVGLLIVGFGGSGPRPLLLGGIIICFGVASMHYIGIAALHVYPASGLAGMAGMQGGVGAQTFLLPLIIGISVLAFILTVVISLSPTEAEIREDAALMARISGPPQHARQPAAAQPAQPSYNRGYGNGQGQGQGNSQSYGNGHRYPVDDADGDSGRWFRSHS